MTVQEEKTLVLEVTDQESRLAMSLYYQDEVASTVRYYYQRSVDFAYADKITREITALLNKTSLVDPEGARLLESMQKSGHILWDHLLAKPVKDKLKDSAPSNLVLMLDESLITIPWELLFDGDEFLCLKYSCGRLVRTSRPPAAHHYREMHPSLKMLIIANPTNDLRSAYQEGVQVRDYIDHKRREIAVDFKSTQVDTNFLKKNLRDYDIVHFAGHCQYDTVHRHKVGWVLEDGILNVKDIMELGEGSPMPSIIFSNACQSAAVSPEAVAQDYQHRTYSFAGAFLFSGVRHYIGAIWKIEDAMSLEFAKGFYQALVQGHSTGACVRQARLALARKSGLSQLAWASYLLYGDPGFVVVHRHQRTGTKKSLRTRILSGKAGLRRAGIAVGAAAGLAAVISLATLANPSGYFTQQRISGMLDAGRNAEAAALAAETVKKTPSMLAMYPLAAQALLRMARHEEASRILFAYSQESERLGDLSRLADAYISLGWFFHAKGNFPKAMEYYQKALEQSQRANDPLHEAVALRKAAVWHIDKGDNARALELLTKSAEINRRYPGSREHKYNLACDYFDTGLVFINKDDYPAAKEFYKRSFDLFTSLHTTRELSDYYFNVGEIYVFEKKFLKAKESYLKGLAIDIQQGNLASLAGDYAMLGDLYLEMEQVKDAEHYLLQSVAMAKQSSGMQELADAYYSLSRLYKRENKISKAKEYLRMSQELYYKMGLPQYQQIKAEFAGLDG